MTDKIRIALSCTPVAHQNYLHSYNSRFIKKYRYNNDKTECPRGEIGRHKGLKIYQSIKIITSD